MKKQILLLLIFSFLFLPSSSIYAANEDRVDDGPLKRTAHVMSRGLLNLVGSPVEIYSTAVREKETHPRVWPLSFIPRTVTNLIIRGASIVNDTLISPFFYAPFTNDIAPLTAPAGLPDYPWQVEPE